MARKKKQAPGSPGSPAWMNTFSDLMNLLLCFFVVLFSMSSVDADKYEQVAASLSSSFSIFDGGSSALEEGQLISSGISQLNDLSKNQTNIGTNTQNNESTIKPSKEQAEEQLKEEQKKDVEALYEEVSETTQENQVEQYVSVSIDDDYSCVVLTLSGSVLFESGSAEIMKSSIPILSRVGDILKIYDDKQIWIEGHTDNKPIQNSSFKNNMQLSAARSLSVWEYMVSNKNLNPHTLLTIGRSQYNPIASNKTAAGRAKNRRVSIKIFTNTDDN